MGGPHDRNVADEVHRALRVHVARRGRSAEIRFILERAVKPAKRVGLGDALAALGRKVGVTDEDIAILDQMRDRSPAKPMEVTLRGRRAQGCRPVASEYRPSPQGTGTPIDLSRAWARPARAFRPSR
jgi:antitoxin FitA